MKFENSDDNLEKQAKVEVAAILGQSVPIRARTLAEAIAEAERLKASENILLGQNSLWNWNNALPAHEREEIGQFQGKRHFWTAVRFRNRPQ